MYLSTHCTHQHTSFSSYHWCTRLVLLLSCLIFKFHKQSKHIAICWHWIQDLVGDRMVKIASCRDPDQMADVLTKAYHI